MELEVVLLVSTGMGIGALVMALIAMSAASSARKRVEDLAGEVSALRRQLVGAEQPQPAPPVIVPVPTDVAVLETAPAPAPPPLARAASQPVALPERTSFEERVALVWFTRLGAVSVLIGLGFFYKYATDSGWLGPVARLVLGSILGCALIAASELGRERTRPVFVNVLTGVGMGVLYLVLWASYVLMAVTSAPVAFAGFCVVTVLGGWIAVRRTAELVLVFSLVGGFLAPILLSTGSDRPLALFVYLVALTALTFAVAIPQRFRIATWFAVVGTLVITVGWFSQADLASRWRPILGTLAVSIEWAIVARRTHRAALDRVTPDALSVVTLAFAHGCAAVLFHDHPVILAAVTVGLAASASVGLVPLVRRELLAVPIFMATVALAAADRPHGVEAALTLVGFAAAMAMYIYSLLREQLSGGRPAVATLAVVGGASSAFVLVTSVILYDVQPMMFALVTLTVAAVLFGLATRIVRQAHMPGSLLLGEAILFAALGIAVLCSEPVTVILFFVGAALMVATAARAEDAVWLAGGMIAFGATAMFVLPSAVDGVDRPLAFVLNARCAMLGVAVIATLGAAHLIVRARTEHTGFNLARQALVLAGHLALLTTILGELATLIVASEQLLLVSTLVLGVYAAVLLAIGFATRDSTHRYLGLGLFAITIAKLGLYDVWSLERVYQMLVLIGVGALLVGAGFLYARRASPPR